ncbi:HAD-IA family hydrolase [Sphingomonas profundi]|uniref:HAD-IA family hydrolase n=1 Tax=Alterirhizorhabdus profundi TaxID=2681549 RepID=UPI0012E73305|nr:HAD-IA family hydrolase [Sphingomonas profundi]
MTADRPNRLAVFDCDGTLVDSQAAICAAMADCFVAAGLPDPGAAATRRVVGLSLVEAVAMLHPAGTADLHAAMAGDYKRAFQRRRGAGLVAEPLFAGVARALADLCAAGWLLGVATGKSDRGLGLCLAHHGLADRFVTLQTADRHPSKPHPAMLFQAMAEAGAAPETTVMIGDTSYDIAMAKAAGAVAVGVAWGYHAPAELFAEGADHVVDHAADLPALLERLP